MTLFYISGLALSGLALVVSASYSIKSLLKIGNYLRLSDFSVGFIFMALVTSAPEFFVGINAALNKVPALSLGDIIGSNIVDIALTIGLVALLARGIKIKGKIAIRDTYYSFALTILPLVLMLDRNLSRIDSAVLLLAFTFYAIRLWNQRKKFSQKEKRKEVTKKQFIVNLFIFAISSTILVLSARYIVNFSTDIATSFGIPLLLIGITVVAIGTDLPELVFEIKAVRQKREGMAFGDTLGSVVAQGTLVLGVIGMIKPFMIEEFTLFLVAAGFLTLAMTLFTIFVRTKEKFSYKEATIMIMLYVVFVIVELSIKH